VIRIISAFLKSYVRPPSSKTDFRKQLAKDPDTVLRALGVDPTLFDLEGAERLSRTAMWRRRTMTAIAGAGVYILGWVGDKAHAQVDAPVDAYGTPPGMKPRQEPSKPSNKKHGWRGTMAAYGTPPGMRPSQEPPKPSNKTHGDPTLPRSEHKPSNGMVRAYGSPPGMRRPVSPDADKP